GEIQGGSLGRCLECFLLVPRCRLQIGADRPASLAKGQEVCFPLNAVYRGIEVGRKDSGFGRFELTQGLEDLGNRFQLGEDMWVWPHHHDPFWKPVGLGRDVGRTDRIWKPNHGSAFRIWDRNTPTPWTFSDNRFPVPCIRIW